MYVDVRDHLFCILKLLKIASYIKKVMFSSVIELNKPEVIIFTHLASFCCDDAF